MSDHQQVRKCIYLVFLYKNHCLWLQFQSNYINLHKVTSGPQSVLENDRTLMGLHTQLRESEENLLCQVQRMKTSTSNARGSPQMFQNYQSHLFHKFTDF